jgi:hypothetical protein
MEASMSFISLQAAIVMRHYDLVVNAAFEVNYKGDLHVDDRLLIK